MDWPRTGRGDAERGSHPTVVPDGTQSIPQGRRDRFVRRALITLMTAFVFAGLFGVFGYSEHQLEATNDGYDVRLTYPETTRGGLAVMWQLTVERADGEQLPRVEVAITADYPDAFDHNVINPDPDSVTNDGDLITWTFEPSGDAELQVTLDMRTQPDARWRYPARTTVVADGTEIAAFEYTTTVMP